MMKSAISIVVSGFALIAMLVVTGAQPDLQARIGGDDSWPKYCTENLAPFTCEAPNPQFNEECEEHEHQFVRETAPGTWLNHLPISSGNCSDHEYFDTVLGRMEPCKDREHFEDEVGPDEETCIPVLTGDVD